MARFPGIAASLCISACLLGMTALAWAQAGSNAVDPTSNASITSPLTKVQGNAVQAVTRDPQKIQPKLLSKPLWSELSAAEQLALAPLAPPEWDTLDGNRKRKWLQLSHKFASMPLEKQQIVQGKMREWVGLTPEQRGLVRQNYALTKKVDPQQKSAQWQEYQQLSEEQKKKLAASANQKKQVAKLPSPSQSQVKPVAPIKSLSKSGAGKGDAQKANVLPGGHSIAQPAGGQVVPKPSVPFSLPAPSVTTNTTPLPEPSSQTSSIPTGAQSTSLPATQSLPQPLAK